MPTSVTTKAHIARLTGEVVALRAVVRRVIAHLALIDGGDLDFLREEMSVMLDELSQFSDDKLSKQDRAAVTRRAQEIINEVFTTIEIGGETLRADN